MSVRVFAANPQVLFASNRLVIEPDIVDIVGEHLEHFVAIIDFRRSGPETVREHLGDF